MKCATRQASQTLHPLLLDSQTTKSTLKNAVIEPYFLFLIKYYFCNKYITAQPGMAGLLVTYNLIIVAPIILIAARLTRCCCFYLYLLTRCCCWTSSCHFCQPFSLFLSAHFSQLLSAILLTVLVAVYIVFFFFFHSSHFLYCSTHFLSVVATLFFWLWFPITC